jgi:cytochrome c biogenesis protein
MSFKNGPVAEYLNSFWKLFASIQLTGVILFSLAIFSAVGTFIPQNKDVEQYLRAFGDFLFRLFAVLDLFDIYHAWWFQMLLILLVVNIIVCSIDRLRATWKIIFPKERHFSTARFRKLKNNIQFDSNTAPDDLKSTFSNLLSRSFGYMKLEDTPNGFLIFAEKGRWTRLGVYAVHLSVILSLLGGLIGSFLGFEGFVTIPEGESIDRIQILKTGETRKLDFAVRCDDFNLTLYPNGTPKEFRSTLTILENGKPALNKDIIVNDPLRYKKISFFQSSYGEVAPESTQAKTTVSKEPPSKVVLNLTSNESNMSYQRETVIGKSLNLPEGLGKLELTEYKANTKFGGQDIGPVIIAVIKPAAGEPKKIVLPLNFPNFDKMRQGKIFISVIDQETDSKASDSPEQMRYFTGLQVTYDPGVWVVYVGFIMMIIGCCIAFFTSHQQVFIEISVKGNKQHVFLSGISNKDKIGMKRKISKLTERLTKLAG